MAGRKTVHRRRSLGPQAPPSRSGGKYSDGRNEGGRKKAERRNLQRVARSVDRQVSVDGAPVVGDTGYNVSAVSASRNSRGVSARSSVDRVALSFTIRASVPTQIR